MEYSSPQLKTTVTSRRPPATAFQISVLLIVIVLFSYFLLWPKYNSLQRSKEELSTAKNSLQTLQADQVKLTELVSQLKQSSNDVVLLDEALPTQSRVSRVYVLVDGLVKASGMTTVNMSVETPTDDIAAGNTKLLASPLSATRKLQSNAINLSVTGTMDQFVNFLKQLETSSRVIDVVAMEVGAGEGANLSFKLTLKTYSYSP